MRQILCAFLLIASVGVAASDKTPTAISASGTMYFIFDMASETTVDGVLFARFVPDGSSLKRFPAVTSGPYPGPVKYISLGPADAVLESTVGKAAANRLSHGTEREIEIPVEIVLANYESTIECDSRVYYAKLVSIKFTGKYKVASRANVPHGC